MNPTPISSLAPAAGVPVRAPTAGTEVPPHLQTALADAGWQHPSERVFRTLVPVAGGRARTVLLSAWGQGYLTLLTPVGKAGDGDPPELGAELAGYVLHTIGRVLMLMHLVPVGPPAPTLAEITGRARRLAARGAAVAAALVRPA